MLTNKEQHTENASR